MGVVFDLYIFVQHLYQAMTGFSDEVVNMVAGKSRVRGGVRRGGNETCRQAEVF